MKAPNEKTLGARSLWSFFWLPPSFFSQQFLLSRCKRPGSERAASWFKNGISDWRSFVKKNLSLIPIILLFLMGLWLEVRPPKEIVDDTLETQLRQLGWTEGSPPCDGLPSGLYEALGNRSSFEWYQTESPSSALLPKEELLEADESFFQCTKIEALGGYGEIK
jgi:hypothetical protein